MNRQPSPLPLGRGPGRGDSGRGAIRREWLVLAGVLIPFAILVAVGLHYTAGSAAPPAPGAYAVNTPQPPPPPIPDVPHASAPPVVVAPAKDAMAAAPVTYAGPPAENVAPTGLAEDTPPGLEAALTALRPAVRQCFDDARAHATSRVEVRVRFTVTPDGHFTGYQLVSRSWQDPYFEACVEDVFDEVTYTPSGREPTGAVTHTFVLGGR